MVGLLQGALIIRLCVSHKTTTLVECVIHILTGLYEAGGGGWAGVQPPPPGFYNCNWRYSGKKKPEMFGQNYLIFGQVFFLLQNACYVYWYVHGHRRTFLGTVKTGARVPHPPPTPLALRRKYAGKRPQPLNEVAPERICTCLRTWLRERIDRPSFLSIIHHCFTR